MSSAIVCKRRARGGLAGLALLALLAGCNQGAPDPNPPDEKPEVKVEKKPPPVKPDPRLHQPFEQAVSHTAEDPPAGQKIEPTTMTGKSTGALFKTVRDELWD